MSRVSLNKTQFGQYGSRRVRKISTTESEYSVEEQSRLTGADGGVDEVSPEDEGSLCEYHDIPPPPDGGYGWVVVFASFMCNMIVDGIAYTFGVFLNEFVNYYGEGKGRTAWVGSLLSGIYLSAGPVVSALTNKYGCRAVCMAGSVFGAAAFALSTLSSSVNMLMLTYGVLGGIGFGLIYLPAVVCVGYYFETKRSLATGIAVCGSGVGTIAFAPLATMLINAYGWKGANLILAGLILNCAVFGAMMRPLEYPKLSSVKPLLQRMAEEKRFQMERGSIGGSYFMVQLPDGSMEKRMKMPINIDPGVHSSFNLDQLVPGTPLTPVPTVPTLPTISEVKVQEQSSSGGTSASGSVDLKNAINKTKSRKAIDEGKESKDVPTQEKPENIEFNKANIPRNASQPAFTTHVQGLPKNGSVPFFDRIRKTSTGERYKPSLSAIKNSRTTLNSNGDIRRSLHLRLSASSMLGSRNNNAECDDGESITFTTSKSSIPKEKPMMIRPLSRRDIFYSGSVLNLAECQSQKSLANYRQSIISLPKSVRGDVRDADPEKGPQQPLCPCLVLPESFTEALATMMDMSLLKDPVFLLIGISNVFGMAGLYVPFVYLVDAAKSHGVDASLAPLLLSIIGITNTVGRVACGYIADFPQVDSLLMNNICLVVSSIAVGATPFCTSFAAYIVMSIFFGLAISGYISLTSIILVDLLGLDKLTNAFGLLILFRGAAAIVGSPLAGAIYDATENYNISFYMAGFFFFISAATSFMAPAMKRCTTPQAQPVIMDTLTPIDEDIEEENEDDIPEIVETAASPQEPQEKEIKQIESVL
ncbi:monocarboxylate transporter 9 isoform X2 [Neodiprion pinetum]|uniref:Monocarboxylate transporter 3 isoform X2 n=1 Tax=Neodiprion lecontei TaxID=441921 RepID=A0A6J0B591_NEOLC|nr:monocarboxylate transporter 3 isoform X2 [Neodiprion lecontei]XP_046483369.1 monocarboxylate transporter 3 isoform X2 [Neodiprion pinetum]